MSEVFLISPDMPFNTALLRGKFLHAILGALRSFFQLKVNAFVKMYRCFNNIVGFCIEISCWSFNNYYYKIYKYRVGYYKET